MSGIDARVAIVTGASAGIGRGIARVFAEKGAKVVTASRSPNPAWPFNRKSAL